MDLETNNHAFEEHQFEEADEGDEPGARQKIKINTPVNTTGLLDNIKANLYKALEIYYEWSNWKRSIDCIITRSMPKKKWNR